jgi:hypothetical protein
MLSDEIQGLADARGELASQAGLHLIPIGSRVEVGGGFMRKNDRLTHCRNRSTARAYGRKRSSSSSATSTRCDRHAADDSHLSPCDFRRLAGLEAFGERMNAVFPVPFV